MMLFYHIDPWFNTGNRKIITLSIGFVPASIIYHGAFLTYIYTSCRSQYGIYLRKQIFTFFGSQ